MIEVKRLENELASVFETFGITKHKITKIAGKMPTLEICIMKKDGNVDLETCDVVSKAISDVLDAIDTSDDSYMLDVCSFGAERVLESKEEVVNEVGNYVHVELLNPNKGLDTVEGTLLSYENDVLDIEYFVKGQRKQAAVDYDNIKLIRLAVKL